MQNTGDVCPQVSQPHGASIYASRDDMLAEEETGINVHISLGRVESWGNGPGYVSNTSYHLSNLLQNSEALQCSLIHLEQPSISRPSTTSLPSIVINHCPEGQRSPGRTKARQRDVGKREPSRLRRHASSDVKCLCTRVQEIMFGLLNITAEAHILLSIGRWTLRIVSSRQTRRRNHLTSLVLYKSRDCY